MGLNQLGRIRNGGSAVGLDDYANELYSIWSNK